jgi:tetratricopeptide (TPR) repeat protein
MGSDLDFCAGHRDGRTISRGQLDATPRKNRDLTPLLCLLAAFILHACSSGPRTANGQALLPVTMPDLSRLDKNVQTQARGLYESLTKKIDDRSTPDAELARSYGETGMLLMAAEFFEAAEPYFLNAQALAPTDVHWPYYLGHLYQGKGDSKKAAEYFGRALQLRPDELATLVHLGRLTLDQGQPNEAETLFTKALSVPPRSVAALAGMGQVALAKQDYQRAVTYLEEAISLDPESVSIHSPLAMAYRGLGDINKAETHLKQWRNRDILVPDPLKQELDLLLESGLSYELRGIRAFEANDWTAAAGFFRKGVELTPGTTQLGRSLRHKLGTALYLGGDVAGARKHFEEVVQLAPTGRDESTAKAYYSLAVLDASTGRGQEAIAQFSRAVEYQPNYVEAYQGLGDALRRAGRVEASLKPYKQAIDINPRSVQARLGYAMALIKLRRYQEARDWLSEAMTLQPDQPVLAHTLARLLAAAPDGRARDGERSMMLVQELFKTNKSTDLGETMAMALAELGEYDKAAAIQRGVMAAAEKAGLQDVVRRMAVNLRLYERHQPCRTPWQDDDPVHNPGPPITAPPLQPSRTS